MRIVVFTSNYPPLRNPRAFRIGRFVKLNSESAETLVITSPVKDYNENEINVIRCGLRINLNSGFRSSLQKYTFFRFIFKLLWPDDKLIHQLFYLFHYLYKYRKKDDIILTVSNPFSSHLIGLALHKIWKHKWKVDIGDIYFENQHSNSISKFFEQLVLRTSDQVIVNSDSLKNHFLQNYNLAPHKISVIQNGIQFDISKIKKTASIAIRLSFIGNTYAGVRAAIDELNILIKLAKTSPEQKIRIQLFGNQYYKVYELANEYPDLIQISYCKNEEELIQAYSDTDILINFANKNNPGLPSKLEEYLASGLPIINFIHSKNDPAYRFLVMHSNKIFHFNLKSRDTNGLDEFIFNSMSIHNPKPLGRGF